MSSSGSVTALIERLQEGDHEAARLLWQRYYPRMVALARQKLKGSVPRVADEEAADLRRHHQRDKRGGGMVHGDSALTPTEGESSPGGFDELPGDGPTPEEAALLAEEVESLLARLRDPVLRQVAVWKLEGHTNAEIAEHLGCSEPTVERRLAIIRRLLKES